jgi:nucleoside-diphosphate-sugar epimerase
MDREFLYQYKWVKEDMEHIVSLDYIPFDKLRNKTVLVTGANGMLAYYFTCVLMHLNFTSDSNIRVIALVRNKEKALKKFEGFIGNSLFSLLVQDVCEEIKVDEPVHYILHAAGAASPKFIKSDPVGIIAANTAGSVSVLEFARKNPVENIVFTSTREIYGKVENVEFIKETDMGTIDPLDSRSCYPESKRAAETLFRSYNVQYGIPFVSARIAHSYGPGVEIDNDGRVMSDFLSDVVNGRDIVLKSDGSAVRAFCYVSDAVAGLLAIMLKGKSGEAYNIANETEPVLIRDAAQLMADSFPEKNISVRFEIAENNGMYCTYKRVGLSTGKLESIGWKPVVSLKDGVIRTVSVFDEMRK